MKNKKENEPWKQKYMKKMDGEKEKHAIVEKEKGTKGGKEGI
jgi:hypothetical protein